MHEPRVFQHPTSLTEIRQLWRDVCEGELSAAAAAVLDAEGAAAAAAVGSSGGGGLAAAKREEGSAAAGGPAGSSSSSSNTAAAAAEGGSATAVDGGGGAANEEGGRSSPAGPPDRTAGDTLEVPGPLWERGGSGDDGGLGWGRQRGGGGGGGGPVEAGGAGGGSVLVSSSPSAAGEWDAEGGTVALRHLQKLAVQLPHKSWQVLCLLLEFLAQVAALSNVNEMTSEVLSQQTFAPLLCRPQGSAFMSLRHVQDLLKIQAVVRVLIENHTILSQNRNASNHASAGSKALVAGQAKGGGKEGLALTLSAGGRRPSSNDLYIVQQLMNDSVSLLVYAGSEGEEDGEESDGSGGRGGGGGGGDGAGRRRGHGELFGGPQAGRLRSFLRPHMLHAPPPAVTAAHFGPPSLSSAGGDTGGPAYLRKHSFFDLDEDEDDASAAAGRAAAAAATAAASAGNDDGGTAAAAGGEGSTASGAAAGGASSRSPGGAADKPVDAATAVVVTDNGSTPAVDEAAKAAAGAVGRTGGDAWGGGAGADPTGRGGRRSVAGSLERRRMMLACRTLRAQIDHYEVNFQAEYGHPPRGRERAPLVSTYAQYKSWKQFIRDDASTQLQATYRGYRERKRHPEVPRLLRKEAPPPPPPPPSSSSSSGATTAAAAAGGGGGGGGPVSPPPQAGAGTTAGGRSPTSEGRTSPSQTAAAAAAAAVVAGSTVKADGFFVVTGSGAATGGGGVLGVSSPPRSVLAAGFPAPGVSPAPLSPVSGTGSTSSSARAAAAPAAAAVATAGGEAAAGGGGEDGVASAAEEEVRVSLTGKLKDLLEEKRGIKGQLKSFDMTFFRRTGRLPTKAEKEPMRHLYDRYNGLKHQIRDVEGLLVAHRQQHSPQLQYTPPQSPYTASPRGVWAEQPGSSSTTPTSSSAGTTAAAAATAAGGGGAGGAANDKLVQLKKEKRVLHVMLKNFEKEFKEKNGREVSCPEDIAPVEGEYQKYKMIKKRLAQLTK
ncbi:unnamed protein product [Ectocarpus sp. 6 AP-2014]